jgi:dephospho-CoA kinase
VGDSQVKPGDRKFLAVAVTGGLSSGKSTLCRKLAELGARTIDADAISREVTRRGSETLRELAERFGPDILQPSGELDRKALGRKAFSSTEGVRDLNRLTHPPIVEAMRGALEGFSNAGYDGVVVVEAALFLEEGHALDLFDVIVAVVCSEACREKRLSRVGGGEAGALRARARSQISDSRKAEMADYTVQNDGDMENLEAKAAGLWAWLSERRGGRARRGK